MSLATPGDYLTQQQIPWFGPGYDATYCPTSGTGFGFSTYGCLIPANPKKLPNPTAVQLKAQLATKGITKPTIALIGHRLGVGQEVGPERRVHLHGRRLDRRVREGLGAGTARGRR